MSGALGIVAIGRNEGQRLRACLESLPPGLARVYVDSASGDGSPELARSLSVDVVELDPALPLSAARARNAGFARLRELEPDLARVQFLDGDCELEPGWLDRASSALDASPELAAVCGRRRERAPDASPYNRLIDMEWDGAPGRVDGFGGDVMLRAPVFEAVGGYDESLIAGEDPELARRIRRAHHEIERLDAAMTRHDADLTRFSQWWTRQVRAGYAAAEAWWREGGGPGSVLGRRLLSNLFWGGALPLSIAIGIAIETGIGIGGWRPGGLSLLALLAYVALALRIAARQRAAGRSGADAALYALACVEGKFAETVGAARFALRGRPGRAAPRELIEYK